VAGTASEITGLAPATNGVSEVVEKFAVERLVVELVKEPLGVTLGRAVIAGNALTPGLLPAVMLMRLLEAPL